MRNALKLKGLASRGFNLMKMIASEKSLLKEPMEAALITEHRSELE